MPRLLTFPTYHRKPVEGVYEWLSRSPPLLPTTASRSLSPPFGLPLGLPLDFPRGLLLVLIPRCMSLSHLTPSYSNLDDDLR